MTKAAKIRRAFSGGRPRQKDEVLGPVEALKRIAGIADAIRADLTANGLDANDLKACLIVRRPATMPAAVLQFGLIQGRMPETVEQLLAIPDPLPIGGIFSIADHESKEQPLFRQWAVPFLTGPEALATLKASLERIAAGKSGALDA